MASTFFYFFFIFRGGGIRTLPTRLLLVDLMVRTLFSAYNYLNNEFLWVVYKKKLNHKKIFVIKNHTRSLLIIRVIIKNIINYLRMNKEISI